MRNAEKSWCLRLGPRRRFYSHLLREAGAIPLQLIIGDEKSFPFDGDAGKLPRQISEETAEVFAPFSQTNVVLQVKSRPRQ